MRRLVISALLLISSLGASAAELSLNESARAFAGVSGASAQVFSASYRERVQRAWSRYEQKVGVPLRKWVGTEVPSVSGGRVFYPFSGPDFLTIAQVYPDAETYTLVAMQKARRPQQPDPADSARNKRIEAKLGAAWEKFGTLGYFRTLDLDEEQRSENPIGVTSILMAFAARLNYDVVSVQPLSFDQASASWKPDEAANWSSVRLQLTKNGKPVTLDYISLDLSDNGVQNSPALRRWIDARANAHVLLKAASHLLQKSYFSVVRDSIKSHARLIIQDETGFNYSDLAAIGDVRLYGMFSEPLPLFTSTKQETLSKAYHDRKSTIKPLPFSFSYLKSENTRSLQIVSPRERQLGKP